MTPLKIKEASNLHKILLALRAGPMDNVELMERFPKLNAGDWSPLVKAGYIKQSDGIYSITQTGREACPARRDIAAKAHAKMPKTKGLQTPEDTDVSGITTRLLIAFVIGNPGATKEQVYAHFAPEKNQYAKRFRLREVIYYNVNKAKSIRIINNRFYIDCQPSVAISRPKKTGPLNPYGATHEHFQ